MRKLLIAMCLIFLSLSAESAMAQVTAPVIVGISGNKLLGLKSGTTFVYDQSKPPQNATTLLTKSGISFPRGIDGDRVVGFTSDPTGFESGKSMHGVLYTISTDTPTILKMPDAIATCARAISGDNIVGNYVDKTGEHGFIYSISKQTYTKIDAPKATSTCPRGIDGDNIVGSYTKPDGVVCAFLYEGGKEPKWTTIRERGCATAICGKRIVGNDSRIGFLYDTSDKSFVELEMDKSQYTWPVGITNRLVVGTFNPPVTFETMFTVANEYGFTYSLETKLWNTFKLPTK